MKSKRGRTAIDFREGKQVGMDARLVETGILQPGPTGYSLALPGGGVWQLDMAVTGARRYLGQRVTVEGFRAGFDMIDVYRISPAHHWR